MNNERWKGQVLTNCDASSLVIDNLCNQARGQDAAVACFYFDFAAQKEQSTTNMLGALLKQVVSALEEVPEEIVRDYDSVPNRPVRTPGPWRPIVPSVPGRVGKDGQARRPSFVNTAGL